MAKKRELRSKKEIREMIESTDMKFVMLNNRLFDDFYSKGESWLSTSISREKW